MKTVGTLKELNVKPGDVVEWRGSRYIAFQRPRPIYAEEFWAGTEGEGWIGEVANGCTIISRAIDTPTLWRDMTPEEKGALLLAHHEGKVIEYTKVNMDGEWLEDKPKWRSYCAYRIKPQPKVEVVTICSGNPRADWGPFQDDDDTHRITFNTIDGKPDPESIEMEEL